MSRKTEPTGRVDLANGSRAVADIDPEDGNRWRPRPVSAAALRGMIIAVPLGAGYLASLGAARLLSTQIAQSRWWLLLAAAASVVVCVGVERLTRRLLPLAALLKLSMLFPDRAPSRFKVARQSVSTRSLQDKVAHARTGSAAVAAEAVLSLITALTLHDRRTRGHSERVRVFADLLGEQLHLPRDARDRLRWAALLHDIGKLTVAPAILNKPAKLNATEWDVTAGHPIAGEQLLGPLVGWLGEWGTAVRQHHERFDGTGYPDGLAGSDIGRAARIIAVVDSFEVMTAHRAYKKPMATANARAELTRCAGTQFDPAHVRAFLAISLPRLLWAMGPGSLLMNLPLLPYLTQAGSSGLAGAQATVLAASAATVIGATGSIASANPAPAASATVAAATTSSPARAANHHVIVSPSHPGAVTGPAVPTNTPPRAPGQTQPTPEPPPAPAPDVPPKASPPPPPAVAPPAKSHPQVSKKPPKAPKLKKPKPPK